MGERSKAWTPTTKEVRSGYAADPEAEYRDPVGYPAWEQTLIAAFDRWLATHDREVAAKALEEEAQRLEDMVSGYGPRDSGQLSAGRDIIRQIRARAATLRPTPSTETNGEQRA